MILSVIVLLKKEKTFLLVRFFQWIPLSSACVFNVGFFFTVKKNREKQRQEWKCEWKQMKRWSYQTVFTPCIQTDCTNIQPQGVKLFFFFLLPSIYQLCGCSFLSEDVSRGRRVYSWISALSVCWWSEEELKCFNGGQTSQIWKPQLQHKVQMNENQ